MIRLFDKRTNADLVRLLIFLIITGLATSVLVVLIGNLRFQSSRTYKAVFSDVAGLNKGDDIRIAGVQVGSVKDIQIVHTNRALVTFDVAKTATVTRSSQATIRYRNLIGQRYISLDQGVGNTSMLPPNSTIPLSQTHPALDLTALFNGFKPLFQALTPADINQLSYEIIQVFQGEGGNLQGLLQDTASLTNTLANKDQVIGALITNLNSVMRNLRSHDAQFSSLLEQLRSFTHGLVVDRNALLGPLNSISNLAEQTAALTQGIRPSFVHDVKGLRKVAGTIDANRASVDRDLQILPIKLNKIGRTAIQGSYFNFYLCEAYGQVSLGGKSLGQLHLPLGDQARCNLS